MNFLPDSVLIPACVSFSLQPSSQRYCSAYCRSLSQANPKIFRKGFQPLISFQQREFCTDRNISLWSFFSCWSRGPLLLLTRCSELPQTVYRAVYNFTTDGCQPPKRSMYTTNGCGAKGSLKALLGLSVKQLAAISFLWPAQRSYPKEKLRMKCLQKRVDILLPRFW